MLRICDFNTFYSPSGGGVRQYLQRKLQFYRERVDVRYSVIVPGTTSEVRQEGAARWYTIRAFPVPGAPNYRWLPGIGELRRILRQERPHLIEVGAPYLSPFLARMAARSLGAKLVGFWHADYPDTYVAPALATLGQSMAELGRKLAWAYARATMGRYDAVFAASAFLVDKLRHHGMGAVYQTPLGVDTELFHPRRRTRSHAEGGDTQGLRTVLYVGRLGTEKGIRTLVKAFPMVAAHHPDARLVVVGHGPLQGLVEDLQRDHASVQFLGYSDSQVAHADLVANAALAVTPSGHETFSLTTLEALSCGTPVVCADSGGAGELVRRSGGGLQFRDGDTADLARAIGEILDWSPSRRSAVGDQARAFAVAHHRWEHVLEHQLGCYRLVIGTDHDGDRDSC